MLLSLLLVVSVHRKMDLELLHSLILLDHTLMMLSPISPCSGPITFIGPALRSLICANQIRSLRVSFSLGYKNW